MAHAGMGLEMADLVEGTDSIQLGLDVAGIRNLAWGVRGGEHWVHHMSPP